MVLFLCLWVLAFVTIGLLTPMLLKCTVRIDRFRPCFIAELSFFYRLFAFRVRGFLACGAPGEETGLFVSVNGKPYKLVAQKPDREKPKKKRSGILDVLVRSLFKTRRCDVLRVTGKTGIAEDACKTVLACGLFRLAFTEAARLLHVKKREIIIKPEFNAPVFWLKVEGILTIRSTQIIGAVFKQRKKRKKGN